MRKSQLKARNLYMKRKGIWEADLILEIRVLSTVFIQKLLSAVFWHLCVWKRFCTSKDSVENYACYYLCGIILVYLLYEAYVQGLDLFPNYIRKVQISASRS